MCRQSLFFYPCNNFLLMPTLSWLWLVSVTWALRKQLSRNLIGWCRPSDVTGSNTCHVMDKSTKNKPQINWQKCVVLLKFIIIFIYIYLCISFYLFMDLILLLWKKSDRSIKLSFETTIQVLDYISDLML